MTIAFRAAEATTGLTYTPNSARIIIPASAVAGDYVLVGVMANNTASPTTWSTPAGWAKVAGPTVGLTFFGKILGSGETYVDIAPSTNCYWLAVAIAASGAYASGAFDAASISAGPAYSGGVTTVAAPSVTTASSNELLISLVMGSDINTAHSWTPPSGMSERADWFTGDHDFHHVTVATVVQAGAGASGTKVFTLSTDWLGTSYGSVATIALIGSPTPTATAITPNAGGPAGGTAVTITGTNFDSGTTVTVGGVACTSVVVVNSTTLTCVTGAHAAGAVDVVVTNGGGSGTLTNGFTYVSVVDNVVKLVKAGAVVGSNLATATEWPASDAIATYGGPTNLWGTTFTPAEINGATAGAVLSVTAGSGSVAMVDRMWMKVYYTLPGVVDAASLLAVLRVSADRSTVTPHMYQLPKQGFQVANDSAIDRSTSDAHFYSSRVFEPSRGVEKVWREVERWIEFSPESGTPGLQVWASVDDNTAFALLDGSGAVKTALTTGQHRFFFPPTDAARGHYVRLEYRVPALIGDQVAVAVSMRDGKLHGSHRPQRGDVISLQLVLADRGEYEDLGSTRRSAEQQLDALLALARPGLPPVAFRYRDGETVYGHVLDVAWKEQLFKGAEEPVRVAQLKVRVNEYA